MTNNFALFIKPRFLPVVHRRIARHQENSLGLSNGGGCWRQPLPPGLFESPLAEGLERYAEVNQGSGEKVILLP